MNNSRLTANITSIILHIGAVFALLLPIWYFSNASITKETIAPATYLVNILNYDKLKDIEIIYNSYNQSLNLVLPNVFIMLSIIVISISLISIILTLILMITKSPIYTKLAKSSKIISIIIIFLSLLTLLIAMIFSQSSNYTVIQTQDINHSISVNLASGLYLFIAIEVAGALCGIVSNNIKD